MEHSAFATFGRRLVAWMVLLAVGVIALKVVFGMVAGIVTALLWTAALIALAVAVMWAVKRI